MALPPATSASRSTMSVVGGRTIERRTRISQPGDENARCRERIPVRIILDASPPNTPFRMGMTAVVTIKGFPPDGKSLSVPGMPFASAR
jgi:hypothetical protein